MHLYRFQPINKLTLTNLSKQKNWVADPLQFNDPFEFHLKEEIIYGKPKEGEINFVERFENREKIKDLISNFGVVCYCRDYGNSLMWSHYADSHKGMCLVFNIPNEIIDIGIHKVEYSKGIHDCYFNVDSEDGWSELINIVKSKSTDWEYENEYRQVFLKKNFHEKYPGELIEIIFGSQTTRQDIDLVFALVKSHYKYLKISKMFLSFYSFKLGKITLTYKVGENFWIPDAWDGKCIM